MEKATRPLPPTQRKRKTIQKKNEETNSRVLILSAEKEKMTEIFDLNFCLLNLVVVAEANNCIFLVN